MFYFLMLMSLALLIIACQRDSEIIFLSAVVIYAAGLIIGFARNGSARRE